MTGTDALDRRLLRRLRGSGAVRRAAARAIAAYARVVRHLTFWRWSGRERLTALRRGGAIIAFWHGRILLIAPMPATLGTPARALVSANRDGDLIAEALTRFGASVARGSAIDPRKTSKAKGGPGALRHLARGLRGGEVAVITPDGPRGPRMRAQVGVSALSALSGAPVYPVGASTLFGIRFGSWDRFLLPLPLGPGALVIGEPVPPPENRDAETIEAHRILVEQRLIAAQDEADRRAGRRRVAPA